MHKVHTADGLNSSNEQMQNNCESRNLLEDTQACKDPDGFGSKLTLEDMLAEVMEEEEENMQKLAEDETGRQSVDSVCKQASFESQPSDHGLRLDSEATETELQQTNSNRLLEEEVATEAEAPEVKVDEKVADKFAEKEEFHGGKSHEGVEGDAMQDQDQIKEQERAQDTARGTNAIEELLHKQGSRKSPFEPSQKEWIRQEKNQLNRGVPNAAEIRHMLQKGITKNKLPSNTKFEQLRQVLRWLEKVLGPKSSALSTGTQSSHRAAAAEAHCTLRQECYGGKWTDDPSQCASEDRVTQEKWQQLLEMEMKVPRKKLPGVLWNMRHLCPCKPATKEDIVSCVREKGPFKTPEWRCQSTEKIIPSRELCIEEVEIINNIYCELEKDLLTKGGTKGYEQILVEVEQNLAFQVRSIEMLASRRLASLKDTLVKHIHEHFSETIAKCKAGCGLSVDLSDMEQKRDLTIGQFRQKRIRLKQEVKEVTGNSERQELETPRSRARWPTLKPKYKPLAVNKPKAKNTIKAKANAKAMSSRQPRRIVQKRPACSSLTGWPGRTDANKKFSVEVHCEDTCNDGRQISKEQDGGQ
jgi:hypothetical protein